MNLTILFIDNYIIYTCMNKYMYLKLNFYIIGIIAIRYILDNKLYTEK